MVQISRILSAVIHFFTFAPLLFKSSIEGVYCSCSSCPSCPAGCANVTIPTTTTSIAADAFNNCDGGYELIRVIVTTAVTFIGQYAFITNFDLTSVILPTSLVAISQGTFEGCRALQTIIIPTTVTFIGQYAFYENYVLPSLILPTSLMVISNQAFYTCSAFQTIIIPTSVLSIGSQAFDNDPISTVVIPTSVTYLDPAAFPSSTVLVYATNSPSVVPTTLTPTIAPSYSPSFDCSCSSCCGCANVTIPTSTTAIANNSFASCGASCLGCGGTQLIHVIIPTTVSSIGQYAFYYNEKLVSVYLPTSLVVVSDRAFSDCSDIQTITIPATVTFIGQYAFYANEALTSLVLPTSLVVISDNAFNGCEALTTIKIPTTITYIGQYAFAANSDLVSVALPTSLVAVSQGAFYYCGSLNTISIPTAVTYIGVNAFYNAYSLTSVSLPTSLVVISNYTFAFCTALRTINIPTSVLSIGPHAFNSDPILTVMIPTSVTYLDPTAFPSSTVIAFETNSPSQAVTYFPTVVQTTPSPLTTTNFPSTAPTYYPSYPSVVATTHSPSTAPTVATFWVGLPSSLPGIVFVVVGITALLLRRAKSSLLNPIKALPWEVLDLFMRGFFLAVLLTKAVINYGAGDITSFVFFLLSRLWIVLLWTIFAFALSRRPAESAAAEEEEGDSSEENRQRRNSLSHHHHLSKMIKFEVLSSKFRVTAFSMVAVCGLLDLSILRLLPWLPTEFSKYVGGYPNLFALRCCVYGSNVALMLQCIASIILLTKGGQSSSDLALSLLSVLMAISLMLKTFMETVFGIQKERSDKMVTVLELDKHLMRSVYMQTASRESLIKKLDEIANLRFSDLEVLWKSQNPLWVSIISDRATSFDKTAIASERFDAGKEESEGEEKGEDVHIDLSEEKEAVHIDLPDVLADADTAAGNNIAVSEEPSSGRYSTDLRFAEKTVDVMKRFIAKYESEVPIYIPLDEIKTELTTITEAVNAGRPFDEKRLDYLLLCMNYNEDYVREREEEARCWRDRMDVFSQECLFTMRGFMPPHIFSASLASLTDTDGLSQPLAKRLLNKQCLWLVRMDPEDIQKLHEADLVNRFNPQGQRLDIVELTAVYACLPTKFLKDPGNKKEKWRSDVETTLRDMVRRRDTGQLYGGDLRHAVYKGQLPLFQFVDGLHRMDPVRTAGGELI